jgi:hypothetical protein
MLTSVQEGNSYEEHRVRSKNIPLAAGSSDDFSMLVYGRNRLEDRPLPLPSSCLPLCWVITDQNLLHMLGSSGAKEPVVPCEPESLSSMLLAM